MANRLINQSIDFIDENPAIAAYQKAQKFDQDQRSGELDIEGKQQTNDFNRSANPTRLRKLGAETTSAEGDAAVNTGTVDSRIANSAAGASLANTNASTAAAEAPFKIDQTESSARTARAGADVASATVPVKIEEEGTRLRQQRATAVNTEMQGFYKSLDLLNAGDVEGAKAAAEAVGHPLPDVVVNDSRVRDVMVRSAKLAKDRYPDKPALQEQYIQQQVQEISDRIKSGEPIDRFTGYTLPPGAPPPLENADSDKTKPTVIAPGGIAIDASGNVLYHNKPATSFNPETLTRMAEQALRGDKSVFTNLGRGAQGSENIAALRERINQIATERNLSGADLAMVNAEFEGLKSGQRTLGTRTANIEMAVAEAVNTFPLALKASDAVPRTDWVPLNRAIQSVQAGTSSPELARFVAANQAVITAYSQAMSRTGVNTVHSQGRAESLLSTATGPDAYKAVIGQLEQEMEAARTAPDAVKEKFRKLYGGQAVTPQGAAAGQPPPVQPAQQHPGMMTPGNGTSPVNIQMPTRPTGVPPDAGYSPGTGLWYGRDGRKYNSTGQQVSDSGQAAPTFDSRFDG